MSLSPWRSRPKLDDADDDGGSSGDRNYRGSIKTPDKKLDVVAPSGSEKKGIWNWKPIRALSHIGMRRLSCLFSVEVVSVQGLPASMNGLRLSVCVRKKETKDGAVQTMPARVLQGAADFEETLFVRCHLYCTSSGSGKQQLKFEPRPFLIYVVAVDAEELNFGRSSVDLSLLVHESMVKNLEGTRVRQWDMSFDLSGKAKGGELVLKLGFQIMEDKGVGIYNQGESLKSNKGKDSIAASPFARKQSKTSFSVTSPRISSRYDASTPSKVAAAAAELQGIDHLNLDEPTPAPPSLPSTQKSEPEVKMEDLDLPEFEVVDKGVEIQDGESDEAIDERSVSSEIVKEVVQDPVHLRRLTELDSIAQQIKALESMMGNEEVKTEQETEFQGLDADEENVTREFLQMLEEEGREFSLDMPDSPPSKLEGAQEVEEAESKVLVPDLGKGLGSVVQTRDGGYLAAMNPFNVEVLRKETPKLAMQISKPLILLSQKSASGFEVFQKMAAIGVEELTSEVLSVTGMDELIGKTAEQIAFEGIASAIIHGRNKEGASSSAARSITTVKSMVTAMSAARKERISTGIWNVSGDPVTAEEILAFSLQKIEVMAVEALKIQAEMAEEEAPFDVSPLLGKVGTIDGKDAHLLASAISLEQWVKNGGLSTKENVENPYNTPRTVTLLVVVQLRDPLRRYEAVGGPTIALVQATHVEATNGEDEEKFKVVNLHVGGLKVRAKGKRHVWDAEKQKLTATQWLVAYGLGKSAKKGKHMQMKGQDSLWSISARVMADMWLKPMRNPDVKFPKQQ